MNDARLQGLSSAEAERRLARLGPVEPASSRSVHSIVVANVFTLFNAILGGFFVLLIAVGKFADATFGLIAVVNTAIGIRQELRAKETLDELALLVAPRARVIRDGRPRELLAEQVVPGDVVRIEPGDQLVADGEVIAARGLTLDESILTGEADGVPKRPGDRALSGAFCLAGSGHYEVDTVREKSYAGRVAGEAREFRHPLSPLQEEVNRVLWATTIAMAPMAVILLLSFAARSVGFSDAAQTAAAGLVTMVPEGLVLLMSVTLAVAAVRLARMRTLVQQMSATEALAAVDTICVDKTGTLTDGTLQLVAVELADPDRPGPAQEALGRFAHSAGERNRTLQVIAERFPASPQRVVAEVPFSSAWKWSGATLDGSGTARSYVLGAPDVLQRSGALALSPALERALTEHTGAGRRVVAFGEAADRLPDDPARQRARLAVAMGSGSQVTKGIADIVLLSDEGAMLPRAVGEGRRIARIIHRLGRLYLTKSVYAGVLILFAAITGFAFPFLPRHLTVAAALTIGIPSFVLALAPSEGPLYRGRLLRSLAAFAVPAGVACGVASLLSFFLVDTVFGGTIDDGRTAATTT